MKVEVLVAQLCLTLCNPMDCSPPGSSVHGISRQEYWSGLPCPPPGDLPDPGIKPTSFISPALAGGFFTTSTTYEALSVIAYSLQPTVSVTKVDMGVRGRGFICAIGGQSHTGRGN